MLKAEHQIALLYPSCGPSCGVRQYTQDLKAASGAQLLDGLDELEHSVGIRSVIFQCCMDSYLGKYQHEHYLRRLVEICQRKSIGLVSMLHTHPKYELINGDIKRFILSLSEASRFILVHSKLSYDTLKKLNIHNVEILPHGCLRPQSSPDRFGKVANVAKEDLLVGSFGSMRHEKGFEKVMSAVNQLNAKFILMSRVSADNPVSLVERDNLFSRDSHSRLKFDGSYLSNDEVIKRLSLLDVIVFAYPGNSNYIATSGAIRLALCSGRPVVCTDAPRFSDLGKEVLTVEDSVEGLVNGIEQACFDPELRKRLITSANSYVVENSWVKIANEYVRYASLSFETALA